MRLLSGRMVTQVRDLNEVETFRLAIGLWVVLDCGDVIPLEGSTHQHREL